MKKKVNNLESIATVLGICIFALFIVYAILSTFTIALYCTKDIEMFWPINASMVIGSSAVLVFLAWIGTVSGMWIRDEKMECIETKEE